MNAMFAGGSRVRSFADASQSPGSSALTCVAELRPLLVPRAQTIREDSE